MKIFDAVIVGGGLAGLVAATRLSPVTSSVALIDEAVPGTPKELGGFARFSGAKFSLFPAGTGLSSLAGGDQQLKELYSELLRFFAKSGITKFAVEESASGEQREISKGIQFRDYHSIVLTPQEVSVLLNFLEACSSAVSVIRGKVKRVRTPRGGEKLIELADGAQIRAGRLIMAAGRLGGELLTQAGVPVTNGKGVDFGVRVEFATQAPVANLRAHGPDAKILRGAVRTFCLNSPGRIFHYPALGAYIPGGIVADATAVKSNVGILRRLPDKQAALEDFARRLQRSPPDTDHLVVEATGAAITSHAAVQAMLPLEVAEDLAEFANAIGEAGLIDWPAEFNVHYPLVDWHWPVFSRPGVLETEIEGVYAVGDLSGHARGLLQASACGWLCVDEMVR